MSLLVRLPLNGNLNNYGSADVTVTVTGTTSYGDGRYSKALSCNGSSYWTVTGVTLGSEASIACWSKTSTNGKMSWVLVSSVSDKLNLYESSQYCLNTGDGNSNLFKDGSGNAINCLHDNQWHHFVVTFGSNVAKLYIDGVYRGTATTFKSPATTSAKTIKLAGGYNNGHSYDWNGLISDFRVYDECLSESEIRHLIRGKGLQVWMPLTKDLRQQGLSNVTVTNNGATFDSAGKLGGCYNIDNASLTFANPLPSTCSEFSICGWVNLNSNFVKNNGLHIISWGGTYSRICVSKDGAAVKVLLSNSAMIASNALDSTVVAEVWNHYAVTFKNGVVCIYINGILDKQITIGISSVTFASTTTTIGNYYSSEIAHGKLNDFRIYDHALSQKEVKELAKGLVLHYPLNRGGCGQENLLKYTKVNATNQNLLKTVSSSWDKLTLTTKDGYDCYLYPSAQSSTWFSSGQWYINMKANTTYTYTAWIYFTATANFTFTSLGHFQVYNSASTASDKAHEDVVSARIYQPSTIPANKWTKVRITFTTNDLANSFFVIYPRYNIAANTGDLYFRDCKLEESAVPTSWCPHSVDNEYTTMGLNSTTEYDCSGFCNNGTRVGALTYSSDTPKYAVSTKITPNSNIQFTPMLAGAYSWTIAAWIKPTVANNDGKAWFSVEQNTFWQVTCYSNQLGIRDSNIGGTGKRKDYSFGTIAANTWVHLVATYDNGTLKLYNNGVLQNTNTVGGTHLNAMNNGRLGSAVQDGYYWNGQISDARIYATALSADDIAELYNGGVL